MILVTGASGFVGGKIVNMRDDVIACPSLRGATEEEVWRIVCESGADTIIHTAAIADIGTCEAHPDEAYHANVMLPVYLARASRGIKLVCFSSDQVYGGAGQDGPYSEDMACPVNLYAKQKLEMEERVLDILPDAVMLRAEWMYDYYLKKPNYFMNMINAERAVRFSRKNYRGITYVREVGENIGAVLRLPGGVYNFGSETDKPMYEITRDFLNLIGRDIAVEDIPPAHNLWMNCGLARKFGVEFGSVQSGLERCARDYGLIK